MNYSTFLRIAILGTAVFSAFKATHASKAIRKNPHSLEDLDPRVVYNIINQTNIRVDELAELYDTSIQTVQQMYTKHDNLRRYVITSGFDPNSKNVKIRQPVDPIIPKKMIDRMLEADLSIERIADIYCTSIDNVLLSTEPTGGMQ